MKNPLRIIRNLFGSLRGYGGCMRCGDSWSWKKDHTIPCKDGGIFPLCEECWSEISEEEKIFWVRELERKWRSQGIVYVYHRSKLDEAIKAIKEGRD